MLQLSVSISIPAALICCASGPGGEIVMILRPKRPSIHSLHETQETVLRPASTGAADHAQVTPIILAIRHLRRGFQPRTGTCEKGKIWVVSCDE